MIYRKVSVQERLPKEDGKYFVWVDCPNAKMYNCEKEQMEFNMDKKNFYLVENEFQSFYEVTHWLEEVPEMLSLLSDMANMLYRLPDIPENLKETCGNLIMNSDAILESIEQEK